MFHRSHRFALAALALVVSTVLITGCTSSTHSPKSQSTSTPSSTHTAKPAVSEAILTAEHVVIQEGLAIALASNVLQSQLQIVEELELDSPPTRCQALSGGGSDRVTLIRRRTESVGVFTNVIYYDARCTQPYITQQASITSNADGDAFSVSATESYTGVGGATLGTLVTVARASLAGTGIQLEGTGNFTLSSGKTVSLGLACQPTPHETILACQGGIAQDFPALGHAVGSVTPLVLHIGSTFAQPITFTGATNSSSVSSLGSLSIASRDRVHLSIAGATAVAGTPATTGRAGGFVLFPSTPTGWTVTNQATGVAFTIAVVDNTTRQLTGAVTELDDQKQIATFSVDRSGTGSITYLGDAPSSITSWLVSR